MGAVLRGILEGPNPELQRRELWVPTAYTAYLATMSGGIDSVAIVAVGSGADASLALAVQMLHLFAVVLAGVLIGRLWSS